MSKPLRVLPMALAMLVAAGCSGNSAKPEAGPHVRLTAPVSGAKLTGLAELSLESTLEQPVVQMNLLVDGETVDTYATLMPALRLDTTHFPDGARQLGVEVVTDGGQRFSDSLDVAIDNPEHRLIRAVQNQNGYGRGEEVVVDLEYNAPQLRLSADFSAIDSSFSSGRVKLEELGQGRYRVHYVISDADAKNPGRYDVEVSSTGSDNILLKSQVKVHFLGAPRLPLTVAADGAVFADVAPNIVIDRAAPLVQIVKAPVTLSEGASDVLTVSWTAPEDNPTDRIILRSPSRSGAWVVPLPAPSTSGSMQIPMTVSSNATALRTEQLTLSVSAVGINGTAAQTVEDELRIVMLSTVGMKVMLFWTGEADLDLAVTTPDKSRIDYDSPSGQGGTLERDSNANCSTASVPAESISWEPSAIVPGQYGIEVSMFDSCGQNQVNYEVLVYACGQIKKIPGTITAGKTNTTILQNLDPFLVDCMQRLTGRVVFDKGSPGSPNAFPVAQVPLRVQGTGATAAPTTTTNDNGDYDITFPAFIGQDLWLEVDAAWMPPGSTAPRVKVVGFSGDTTATAISRVGPLATAVQQHNVTIAVSDGSGAFNILEIVQRAYSWVGRNFNQATAAQVKDLVVRWEAGKPTPDGGSYSIPVSASSTRRPQLLISGDNKDPDEFDDSVMAHEFTHCFAGSLGIDDSRGGVHKLDERVVPPFAWSEGLATAIGQEILCTPDVRFEGSNSLGWINIEYTWGDASGGTAWGTSDKTSMTGNVNEFLVAAVLWDLLDPLNTADDIDHDNISSTGDAVYATLSRYLPSADWVKRGYAGRDLVDFLDGWRCYQGLEAARSGASPLYTELDDLLMKRGFPYTAPTQSITCH